MPSNKKTMGASKVTLKKTIGKKASGNKGVAKSNSITVPEGFNVLYPPTPDTITCVPRVKRAEYEGRYGYVTRFLEAYRKAFPNNPDQEPSAETYPAFLKWLLAHPQKKVKFSEVRSIASSWCRYKNALIHIYTAHKANQAAGWVEPKDATPEPGSDKDVGSDEDVEMEDPDSPGTVERNSMSPSPHEMDQEPEDVQAAHILLSMCKAKWE